MEAVMGEAFGQDRYDHSEYLVEYTGVGLDQGFLVWLKQEGFKILGVEYSSGGCVILFRDNSKREHRVFSGDVVRIDPQGRVSTERRVK